MAQISNILYPVDFTEHHAKVLPLVKEMVEKLGATLHTIHVVEDLSHYSNFFIPILPWIRWRSISRPGPRKRWSSSSRTTSRASPP